VNKKILKIALILVAIITTAVVLVIFIQTIYFETSNVKYELATNKMKNIKIVKIFTEKFPDYESQFDGNCFDICKLQAMYTSNLTNMTLYLLYSGNPYRMPADDEIKIIIHCRAQVPAGGDGAHDSKAIEYIRAGNCK
jgi:hypothetical protein